VGGAVRQLLELVHLVDIGTRHGNVGDPFEDHLDNHGNPVFGHQLFGLLQRGLDIVRVEDAQRLAAEAFSHLDVIGSVPVHLGRVDVLVGQLDTVVHVETTLRLTNQPQVGVVDYDMDVTDV